MKRHLSIVFEAFRHPQIQSRREKRKNNFYVSPLSYLRVFMLAYFYERRNTHKEIQKKIDRYFRSDLRIGSYRVKISWIMKA